MKNRILFISLLTLAAALAVVAVPRFQESKDQLSEKQALALMRTIGSTEATLKYRDSAYGSLQDVIKLDHLGRNFPMVSIDSSSATIKNYRISVVTATDGQHFQVSLHPAAGCGISFFSSEMGVIYQGNALGCSPELMK